MSALPKGAVGITEDHKVVILGKLLFTLKDTHGLPLEMSIDKVINDCGMAVEWPSFIEAARANNWYDFQTFKAIQHGLEDAGVPRPMREGILDRVKRYILVFPIDI